MQLVELRADNFKRLKAVRIHPTGPVTPITGRNGAGKTSVLDAISAALGGAAQSPELPIRVGAETAEVLVDLGEIKVRRRWKADATTTLEVYAADGSKLKSPQSVIDAAIGKLWFDPLAFARMKPAEQAGTLARIAGIDLLKYQTARRAAYDARRDANRDVEAARAQLAGMPEVDAPDVEQSMGELLEQLSAAHDHNKQVEYHQRIAAEAAKTAQTARDRMVALKKELLAAEEYAAKTAREAELCKEQAEAKTPIDPSPIQDAIRDVEQINAHVRAKRERAAKAEQLAKFAHQADIATAKIDQLDAEHRKALDAANLPIPSLGLTAEGVTLADIPFAQCCSAEQLRCSVSIGFADNPKLRLMLIRDGSLLDQEGMTLLATMATEAKAQVLIERVGTSGDVGVLIEDGEVV